MNRKRQKYIEEVALQILRETDCFFIPVDVAEVARRKGAKVISHEFGEDISGVLIIEGNKTVIGVNSEQKYEPRRRFTVAHELGHYILGHQRAGVFVDTAAQYFTILYRDSKSSTGEFIQEREANAFAAALLMPEEMIDKVIKETVFNFNVDNVIEILASKFNVSTQAMAFRLANLGFGF